jgi:hypothetical protein
MCEYFDYRVLTLKRVRIMHIQLGHLKPGTYRNLSKGELERLQTVLKNSSGLPAAVEKQRKQEQQAKAASVVANKTGNKNGAGYGKKTENRRTGRTVK